MKIDPVIKAQAIADLMTGTPPSIVAKTYTLKPSTVRNLASDLRRKPVAPVASQQREELGQLVYEYVAQSLRTLAAQARAFTDENWLKKYGPHEAGVLHGIMAERITRVLAALEPTDERSLLPENSGSAERMD